MLEKCGIGGVIANEAVLKSSQQRVQDVSTQVSEISDEMKKAGFFPSNVKAGNKLAHEMAKQYVSKLSTIVKQYPTTLIYVDLQFLEPLQWSGDDIGHEHKYTTGIMNENADVYGNVRAVGKGKCSLFQGLSYHYTKQWDAYEKHFRIATLFAQLAMLEVRDQLQKPDPSMLNWEMEILQTIEQGPVDYLPNNLQLQVLPLILHRNIELIHPMVALKPETSMRRKDTSLARMYCTGIINKEIFSRDILSFQLTKGNSRTAKLNDLWRADCTLPLLVWENDCVRDTKKKLFMKGGSTMKATVKENESIVEVQPEEHIQGNSQSSGTSQSLLGSEDSMTENKDKETNIKRYYQTGKNQRNPQTNEMESMEVSSPPLDLGSKIGQPSKRNIQSSGQLPTIPYSEDNMTAKTKKERHVQQSFNEGTKDKFTENKNEEELAPKSYDKGPSMEVSGSQLDLSQSNEKHEKTSAKKSSQYQDHSQNFLDSEDSMADKTPTGTTEKHCDMKKEKCKDSKNEKYVTPRTNEMYSSMEVLTSQMNVSPGTGQTPEEMKSRRFVEQSPDMFDTDDNMSENNDQETNPEKDTSDVTTHMKSKNKENTNNANNANLASVVVSPCPVNSNPSVQKPVAQPIDESHLQEKSPPFFAADEEFPSVLVPIVDKLRESFARLESCSEGETILREIMIDALDIDTNDSRILQEIRSNFGEEIAAYVSIVMENANPTGMGHCNVKDHIFNSTEEIRELPAIVAFYIGMITMCEFGDILGNPPAPKIEKISEQGLGLPRASQEYHKQWSTVPKANMSKKCQNMKHSVMHTTGDGNCLLHAINITLFGTQSSISAEKTRWFLLRDVFQHPVEYFHQNEMRSTAPERIDLICETVRLMRKDAYLPSWHLWSVANVFQIKIDEYFPQLPSLGSLPYPAKKARTTYTPFESSEKGTISILDCGSIVPYTGRQLFTRQEQKSGFYDMLSTHGTFHMNHYSALIPISRTALMAAERKPKNREESIMARANNIKKNSDSLYDGIERLFRKHKDTQVAIQKREFVVSPKQHSSRQDEVNRPHYRDFQEEANMKYLGCHYISYTEEEERQEQMMRKDMKKEKVIRDEMLAKKKANVDKSSLKSKTKKSSVFQSSPDNLSGNQKCEALGNNVTDKTKAKENRKAMGEEMVVKKQMNVPNNPPKTRTKRSSLFQCSPDNLSGNEKCEVLEGNVSDKNKGKVNSDTEGNEKNPSKKDRSEPSQNISAVKTKSTMTPDKNENVKDVEINSIHDSEIASEGREIQVSLFGSDNNSSISSPLPRRKKKNKKKRLHVFESEKQEEQKRTEESSDNSSNSCSDQDLSSNDTLPSIRSNSESESDEDDVESETSSIKISDLPRIGDNLKALSGPAPFEFKLKKFIDNSPKERIEEGNLTDSGHLVKLEYVQCSNKIGRYSFVHDHVGAYTKPKIRTQFYVEREKTKDANFRDRNSRYKCILGSDISLLKWNGKKYTPKELNKLYKVTMITSSYVGKNEDIPKANPGKYKVINHNERKALFNQCAQMHSFTKIVTKIGRCDFDEDENPWKDIAYVEYHGTHPNSPVAHGNSKNKTSQYLRNNPRVLNELGKKVLETKKKPAEVYREHLQKNDSEMDRINRPRNVYDKVAQIKKKINAEEKTQQEGRKTVSKEIDDLINRFHSAAVGEKFIQEITMLEHHADPLVICYTAKTMKRAATYIKARQNVILGVDRTFDLSKYFVTTLTLSFDNFVNPENKTSPTMSLAYLFHTKANSKYYSRFFQKVKEALEDASLNLEDQGLNIQTTGPEDMLYQNADEMNIASFSIGSDQEKAILKAARSVFPNLKHVLCMLHLKKNALTNLSTRAVTSPAERNTIMHDIFGLKHGLISSKTENAFDLQLSAILEEYEDRADVQKYISLSAQQVREFAVKPFFKQNVARGWCNNGSESVNCVLKRLNNWEPLPLLGLIDKIQDLSYLEEEEIQRMIMGRGRYRMTNICKSLNVKHPTVWKNTENKEKHILKLFSRVEDKKRYIMEDGDPSSIADVPQVAKKPGTASARGRKTRSATKKSSNATKEMPEDEFDKEEITAPVAEKTQSNARDQSQQNVCSETQDLSETTARKKKTSNIVLTPEYECSEKVMGSPKSRPRRNVRFQSPKDLSPANHNLSEECPNYREEVIELYQNSDLLTDIKEIRKTFLEEFVTKSMKKRMKVPDLYQNTRQLDAMGFPMNKLEQCSRELRKWMKNFKTDDYSEIQWNKVIDYFLLQACKEVFRNKFSLTNDDLQKFLSKY